MEKKGTKRELVKTQMELGNLFEQIELNQAH